MEWYNELSRLLFSHNQYKDGSFDGVQSQLEKRVVHLYQQLLTYLMKSVCSTYRSRVLNFLRDALQLDDWDGNLGSVKDAEKAVQDDNFTYKNEKKTAHLETIVDLAKSSEDKECLQCLRLTDPRHDKKRIEQTKGGLLQDSYRWILDNDDFRQWHKDKQSRLLLIKGDPGKGKTMLLCGIIDELKKKDPSARFLSYFFCQATDSRINSAVAVLRGLLFLLVDQQQLLISHVRKRYDQAGKSLFEDTNTWVALSEIFIDVLQDPSLEHVYLIIDALDECIVGLPQLLDLILQVSSSYLNIKWLVSSRNLPRIEERLEKTAGKAWLSLELNAKSLSTAVNKYIEHQVRHLALTRKYDDKTQNSVHEYLSAKADGTFLWVALVCQNLSNISKWNTLTTLETFPPGLEPLYRRMIRLICDSDNSDLLKQILALATTAYRPITLSELTSLVDLPKSVIDNPVWLVELVKECGSFLTLDEDTIYLVHQSVKDFVFKNVSNEIFPSGTETMHYQIYSRSLELMSKTLRSDIYRLRHPGFPIEQVQRPDPDPLAQIRYASLYWIEHLVEWSSMKAERAGFDLRDHGVIDQFLSKKYLYWLEVLSLLGEVSSGTHSMGKLEGILPVRTCPYFLFDF